jgi:hypothetical protein
MSIAIAGSDKGGLLDVLFIEIILFTLRERDKILNRGYTEPRNQIPVVLQQALDSATFSMSDSVLKDFGS